MTPSTSYCSHCQEEWPPEHRYCPTCSRELVQVPEGTAGKPAVNIQKGDTAVDRSAVNTHVEGPSVDGVSGPLIQMKKGDIGVDKSQTNVNLNVDIRPGGHLSVQPGRVVSDVFGPTKHADLPKSMPIGRDSRMCSQVFSNTTLTAKRNVCFEKPVYAREAMRAEPGCTFKSHVISLGKVTLKKQTIIEGHLLCHSSDGVQVGEGSKLGDITCSGSVCVAAGSTVGNIRAVGNVEIGDRCKVGDIHGAGTVSLGGETYANQVRAGGKVSIERGCTVESVRTKGNAFIKEHSTVAWVEGQDVSVGADCRLKYVRAGGDLSVGDNTEIAACDVVRDIRLAPGVRFGTHTLLAQNGRIYRPWPLLNGVAPGDENVFWVCASGRLEIARPVAGRQVHSMMITTLLSHELYKLIGGWMAETSEAARNG